MFSNLFFKLIAFMLCNCELLLLLLFSFNTKDLKIYYYTATNTLSGFLVKTCISLIRVEMLDLLLRLYQTKLHLKVNGDK